MAEFLAIEALESFYGDFHALHGVSLNLHQGEVLALIGANRAGKSTLLKTIVGLVSGKGSVRWKGANLLGQRANTILARGIALVPEGRRLFPSLSVEENLVLGARSGARGLGGLGRFMTCSRYWPKSTMTPPPNCRAASSRWWPSAGR